MQPSFESHTPAAHDVDGAEFDRAVLERSRSVPVVVDFWAPWCGPCRVLGPVLEREIAALAGRVELVKVNTDQNPELAQSFGVSGIPDVKAFRDGQVVSQFVGAQPANAVRSWLAALAPSEAEQALATAERLVAEGKPSEAEPLLLPLAGTPELRDPALVLLARALLDLGRPAGVPALLDSVDPRSPAADRVPALRRRLQFAADAESYGGEARARAALAANERDLDARWALASALAARADWSGALEELLTIVTRSRKYRDDGARLAMLAIFDQLGSDDLAREFRRRLQIVT